MLQGITMKCVGRGKGEGGFVGSVVMGHLVFILLMVLYEGL